MRFIVALTLLAPALALADDAQSASAAAEDELFGGSSTVEVTTSAEETGGAEGYDAFFGGSTSSQLDAAAHAAEAGTQDGFVGQGNRILERLLETNDRLTIGGRVFVRTQYDALDEGRLGDFQLQSPNLLDVYLDARPSDRIRAYIRTRSVYDPGAVDGSTHPLTGATQQRFRTNIDQFWLKFDVAKTVFVTLGKQRIKWGSGRAWNPTDFLNPLVLDPLAVIDERLGVSLLKLHVPVESLGWNFYGIVDLESVSSVKDVGGALRAEVLVPGIGAIGLGDTEFALSAAFKNNYPMRFGADASTAWGPFDLRAEVGVMHPHARNTVRRVTRPADYWRTQLGRQASAQIPGFPEGGVDAFPTSVETEDLVGDWIPQAVIGAEITLPYSDQDNVSFGAEYFYNGLGYDSADYYGALLLGGQSMTATGGQLASDRRVLGSAFNPLYNGRHYASAYALLMGPGSWNDTSFIATWIANLSDNTHVARLQVNQTLLTYLSGNAYFQWNFGAKGGEFRFAMPRPDVDAYKQDIADLGVPDDRKAELNSNLDSQFERIPASVYQPPQWQAGLGFQLNI